MKCSRRVTTTIQADKFLRFSSTALYDIALITTSCILAVFQKMFTGKHQMKQPGSALIFLDRYNDKDDESLNQILTDFETWTRHIIPESKQQSREYTYSRSSKSKNSKRPCQRINHSVHSKTEKEFCLLNVVPHMLYFQLQ